MLDFLQTPTGKVVIMLSLLAILVIVGVYVVLKLRGRIGNDQPNAQDMMTNFREMHDQGEISDVEFRKLKTVLGDKMHEELNDTADKG